MSYTCPRGGGNVTRRGYKNPSRTENMPYAEGGEWIVDLAGGFIAAVFGGFKCEACGKIPRREFPSEVRAEMSKNTKKNT